MRLLKDKYEFLNTNPEGLEPGTKCYRRESLNILISPPIGTTGWHMSISHGKRLPYWHEIKDAWYSLVPDAENKEGHLVLPKKSEYVNVHTYCMHVYEKI